MVLLGLKIICKPIIKQNNIYTLINMYAPFPLGIENPNHGWLYPFFSCSSVQQTIKSHEAESVLI